MNIIILNSLAFQRSKRYDRHTYRCTCTLCYFFVAVSDVKIQRHLGITFYTAYSRQLLLFNMAAYRPKSPGPTPSGPKKDDKEESFWDKIGTLGRKKKIKEGKIRIFNLSCVQVIFCISNVRHTFSSLLPYMVVNIGLIS